jgi:hypothetical protein
LEPCLSLMLPRVFSMKSREGLNIIPDLVWKMKDVKMRETA